MKTTAKRKPAGKGKAKRVYNPETGGTSVVLDEKELAMYAEAGTSDRDLALIYDVSESTLQGRFGAILKKARARQHARLHAKQYSVALQGNTAMLIWLGKQYLEQSEKIEQASYNSEPIPAKKIRGFLKRVNYARKRGGG